MNFVRHKNLAHLLLVVLFFVAGTLGLLHSLSLRAQTVCVNPAPEVQTNTCQQVGYPAGYGGTYTSTRQFSCATNSYSAWERIDTCAQNGGRNLQSYFPKQYTINLLRRYNGNIQSDYRFYPVDASTKLVGTTVTALDFYKKYFNNYQTGYPYIWEKRYGAERTCMATSAFLFMGNDQSVTEMGDWYADDGCNPSVAFGYNNPANYLPTGLVWSGKSGLRTPESKSTVATPGRSMTEGISVMREVISGGVLTPYKFYGSLAWNDTVVKEVLPKFTPTYGRSSTTLAWGKGLGTEYKDVLRVIFYHGTKEPGHTDFVCPLSGMNAKYAPLYVNKPGYHTYASEFYFAPGKGIIQETFLYTETGAYWKKPDCSMGLLFEKDPETPAFSSYIDDSPRCSQPEVVTNTCAEVGYPATYTGSYVSSRSFNCSTGTYSAWTRKDTCQCPAPQVVTNTCAQVGYPASYKGSYTSTRTMNCSTGVYSDWVRTNTCTP